MLNGLTRELIAVRAALELRDGMYVNLGIGLPTLVANFLPAGVQVFLHCENGILGYGGPPTEEEMDTDLINAGGEPVTLAPGASFCNHADSFAIIRGGHLDLAILGGFQVSERGDLANWRLPHRPLGLLGGAMDVAYGCRRVIVVMRHSTPAGEPRIVRECTFPLTAKGVADTIITNLALIEATGDGLVLREVAPGVSADEVQAATAPRLIVSPALKEMEL